MLLTIRLYLRVILYDRHPDHDRTSLTTPLWNDYGSIIAQSRRVCQVPAPSASKTDLNQEMTNSQLVARVSRRVWGRHAPTRPRLRSNERPSGAFEWQPGLAQARWRGFAPTRAASKRGSVAEVQSRKGTTFSRIENLRPRDGSCSVIAIAVVVIL